MARKKFFKRSKDKKQDRRIKRLERVVNAIEIKTNEPTITGLTAMTTTLTWRPVSAIAQNDTISGRTGNKVNPIEAQVRWTFQNTDTVAALTARGMLVRLIGQGIPPADADMFVFASASPHGALDYGSAVSYRKGKFHQRNVVDVLYDTGPITLAPVDTTAGAEFATDTFKRDIRLRKKLSVSKQIGFEGTASTDDNMNGIYWVTWALTTDVDERGSLQIVFIDP